MGWLGSYIRQATLYGKMAIGCYDLTCLLRGLVTRPEAEEGYAKAAL